MAIAKQIYVNLPVKDLKKSMAFFSALGFGFNPQYTDENAACLILGDNLYSMLLVESFFKTFISKDVVNAKVATEVLVAFSVGTRQEVDSLVAKAVNAGGKAHREPADHGFMYQHSFEDLDGHIWEVLAYT